MSTAANSAAAAKKAKEQEQIINDFQKLREEQRLIASKTAELQMDAKSHDLVIETLKEVDKDRKCFRMIGGVLVERTVKEVLPALETNKEQISKLIETLETQIKAKGKEINDYREKHNIRFQGEAEQQETSGSKSSGNEASSKNADASKAAGILVEKSS